MVANYLEVPAKMFMSLEQLPEVQAYAKDPSGNVSLNFGSTTVTVDEVAPVVTGVTIDLDDLSDTGVKNNDNITNDNTQLLH